MSSDQITLADAIHAVARALGVTEAVVETALRTIPGSDVPVRSQEDRALDVVKRALEGTPLRILRSHPGRPFLVDVAASEPVSIGFPESTEELLTTQHWFSPLVMQAGDVRRFGVFRTSKRMARIAQFTITLPKRVPYDAAFLVLANEEERVWQVNAFELQSIYQHFDVGTAWRRLRVLRGGVLRFELPKTASEWDLASRLTTLPPARPS